jgi:hypothetical protein
LSPERSSYRLTAHDLISASLRNETAIRRAPLPVAAVAGSPLEPLLLAPGGDGTERAAIFALKHGAGVTIYDLQEDVIAPDYLDRPILARLADPEMRAADLSALVAVDRASERDADRPVPVGIVLDDRPANFDYLRCEALEAWLSHTRELCEEVHLDFAWTPALSRPDPRYLNILKRFGVGFVWHGFWRHVNHSCGADWDGDFEKGRRLVTIIAARYGVDFQPIMIFPFERANPEAVRLARREGFIASFENPDNRSELERFLPSFMRYSTPLQPFYGLYYPVLRRFPASALSRDRMLALTALGLPVVASAHPKDLGLQRLPGLRKFRGSPGYFDGVCRFAAAKGLRPLSLEQIAREMLG